MLRLMFSSKLAYLVVIFNMFISRINSKEKGIDGGVESCIEWFFLYVAFTKSCYYRLKHYVVSCIGRKKKVVSEFKNFDELLFLSN